MVLLVLPALNFCYGRKVLSALPVTGVSPTVPSFLSSIIPFYGPFCPGVFCWCWVYSTVPGNLYQTRFASFFQREQLTFAGVWVMFNIMSLSKFKLPHYLNILFPLMAIFSAAYLWEIYTEAPGKADPEPDESAQGAYRFAAGCSCYHHYLGLPVGEFIDFPLRDDHALLHSCTSTG